MAFSKQSLHMECQGINFTIYLYYKHSQVIYMYKI
ncbi:unnamed protein product [Spirodela intermedia]|uniref:Uncharacterized protein n=1 Tax=Spirodela intermedia TaxID=51605 RepID=A0A7I8KUX3_SPIIN|nr:unnamed protein product [Spirodela intermedia]